MIEKSNMAIEKVRAPGSHKFQTRSPPASEKHPNPTQQKKLACPADIGTGQRVSTAKPLTHQAYSCVSTTT